MRADAQEVAVLLDMAPMVEKLRALQKLPRTDLLKFGIAGRINFAFVIQFF